MECKNCGKEIPEDSKYCTFCGHKTIQRQGFLKKHFTQIRDVLFLSVLIFVAIELCLVNEHVRSIHQRIKDDSPVNVNLQEIQGSSRAFIYKEQWNNLYNTYESEPTIPITVK